MLPPVHSMWTRCAPLSPSSPHVNVCKSDLFFFFRSVSNEKHKKERKKEKLCVFVCVEG